MLCIGRWMSEKYLRSISQARGWGRMKSVLCYAKPSPIARNTVFPPFLSVSCQGWVVMRLRCLPQSKNSLTVASTSISRRRSLTCLGMTTNHPCLPCHVSNALHLCTVGAREHHLPSQEGSNISPKVAIVESANKESNLFRGWNYFHLIEIREGHSPFLLLFVDNIHL